MTKTPGAMSGKRTTLITLLLLVGILAVPVARTYREVRRERLNQALIAAVDRNDTAGVRRLLHAGADPNAPVLPEDKRPVWKRMWDILRHRNVKAAAPHESAVTKAVVSSHSPFRPPPDTTATLTALADAGADVNHHFIEPFYYTSSGGHEPPHDQWLTTPLIWKARYGEWRTVKALLAYKVNVNAKDWRGDTALVYAVDAAQTDVVAALLQRGANVNVSDDTGQTILFDAVQPTGAKIENVRTTVACLLRYGASAQSKDRFGNTVLSQAHWFWHDKKLIQMLKRAGAKE